MKKNWAGLTALSPLDGRYLDQTVGLRDYFSEAALIKHRILIEVSYLIELGEFLQEERLNKLEKNRILKWVRSLKAKDLIKVKQIETEIKHDVKAVEYFIKANLKKLNLARLSSWIHWGLTSEDVTNLAYGLMIQKAKDKILIPLQLQLIKLLVGMAERYKNIVMPAKTHGQIAIPTTVGKELIIFPSRALFFLEKIINLKLGGKLNGAVGNFNAQQLIFPRRNWIGFSKKFIKKLGLEPTSTTTQIETGARLVYLLDNLRQINNIWLDLARDCWLYISYDYFAQKIVKKEVGSSTLPHKVNPIDFENAEGNLQLTNGLLLTVSNKLPLSRLQRDLSDSTIKRNLGSIFGYSLLAVKSLVKGLNKIEPNLEVFKGEINNHPEMLTEALQLILKTWGEEKAYEKIKQKSRGKKIAWLKLINHLELSPGKTASLKKWKAKDYIGLATELTDKEIRKIRRRLP